MGNIVGEIVSLIWVGLLIHWLSKKSFYPVAGKDRQTKAFWGVTFLMLNPLMTLLYFVFGVCLRLKEQPPKHVRLARIIVVTLFTLSIPLALPLGKLANKPRVVTQDTKRKAYDFSTKATACFSENPAGMSGGLGFETISYLDIHRIAILNQSDDPLAIKTSQKLQQWLLNNPAVDEVAYYPKGTYPQDGRRLPSVYIELDVDKSMDRRLPLARNIDADISFRISTLQSMTSQWLPLPVSSQSCSIDISHKSSVIGYESYAAKYETAAEYILKTMFTYMKSMSGSWYASAPIPDLPDYALGTYSPTPSMPFDQNELLRKISGYDLLTQNQTTWWFIDSRSSEEALAAYRGVLIAEGWEDHSNNAAYLRLKRGSESLSISRCENTPKKGPTPMIARYRNRFSPEETDRVLEQLLADENIPPDTLLFFGRQFRETESKVIVDSMCEKMEKTEPASLAGHLELSRFWESQGAEDKARSELLLAVASQYLNSYDGSTKNRLKEQAEKIGKIELATTIPSASMLQSIGLIPLENVSTNLTITITSEKPFGFYVFLDDDYQQSQTGSNLHTYVFKITRDPFRAGFYSPSDLNWALTVIGRSSNGAQSWSFTDGGLSNNLWKATWSGEMPEPLKSRAQVNIQQINDEQFEFAIKPRPRPIPPLLLKLQNARSLQARDS